MTDIGAEVLFIAGFGPIDRDIAESRKLYADSLGISFKEDAGGYLYTAVLQGAKHFALWASLSGGAVLFWHGFLAREDSRPASMARI
jgi:hypothetical protein